MAYSAADVAAADRTLAAADCPMLGAQMVVSPNDAEWRQGGSWAAGSDESAAANPARWGYDGFTDLVTKPGTSQTTWYYLLSLSSSPITFDFVAILGHNFGTITGLTVSVEIANNNAYSTNLLEVTSFSPGTSNDRLVDLVLGGATAQRYTSVPYVRLKITGTSGAPEVGELILGKRCQLQNKPDRPYDNAKLYQNAGYFVADSGVRQDYAWSRGARQLVATIPVTGATKIAEVRDWFDDTQQGTRRFVWVEDPNTSPATSLYLMSMEGENKSLDFDGVGPNYNELRLSAVEQGPDFLKLE